MTSEHFVDLNDKRIAKRPVRYVVEFNHDELGFWIRAIDIGEDERSKASLAHYLRRAAEMLSPNDGDGKCGRCGLKNATAEIGELEERIASLEREIEDQMRFMDRP